MLQIDEYQDDVNRNDDSMDEENTNGSVSSFFYTDRCLPKHWLKTKKDSIELSERTTTITTTPNEQPSMKLSTIAEMQNSIPKYMASFPTQLRLLTYRAVKQTRGERISSATIIAQLCFTVFESVLWFRLKDDTNNIYRRNSLIFFFIIAQSNGLVTQSVPIFRRDRALVSRERSKKMYRVLPYYFAKTMAELTTSILLPMVHVGIVYFTANLRPGAGPFFMFMLLFYLTLTSAQSIGYIISAALPSLQLALIITPTITIFLLIMGGFYIPLPDIPPYIAWTKWLSYAAYGYSGLLINEYSGREIPCAEIVSISIGGPLSECPKSGEDVLNALGITGLLSHLWFNILMLILLQLVCRWGAYVLLRRSP